MRIKSSYALGPSNVAGEGKIKNNLQNPKPELAACMPDDGGATWWIHFWQQTFTRTFKLTPTVPGSHRISYPSSQYYQAIGFKRWNRDLRFLTSFWVYEGPRLSWTKLCHGEKKQIFVGLRRKPNVPLLTKSLQVCNVSNTSNLHCGGCLSRF